MPLILVVEDNRMLRVMFAAGLSGYGYQVAEAESLAEARAVFEAGMLPESVLLDLQLPDGSGSDLIHYIRQELGRSDIRIIVTTGNSVEPGAFLAAGADAVLQKPIAFEVLFDQLEALRE